MQAEFLHHLCDYGFVAPIHEPPVFIGTCRVCGAQVVKVPANEEDVRVLLALAPCSKAAMLALAILEIEPPWLTTVGDLKGLHEEACRGPPEEDKFWEAAIGQKILGAFELVQDWTR